MQESDETHLRDSEVALMDAIKTVVEVFIAKKITTADALAGLFDRQSKTYPQDAMPKAVFVMEALRDFANDPERKKARDLLQSSAAGSA
jgi:hypothetical protein